MVDRFGGHILATPAQEPDALSRQVSAEPERSRETDAVAGKAGGPAPRPVAPRRAIVPPPPIDRLRMWGMLLFGLFVLLPPLLIGLERGDTTFTMEKITLLSSQETWLRQADQGGAEWLVPSWNGRPRVAKPPMSVWINLLAWLPLDPAQADPNTLVFRARLTAVGFALLVAACTFWAGMSVGGIRVATIAMLTTGTSLLFVKYARYSCYDTHMMGFVALAIAAALWAMRPIKLSSGIDRRVMGWLLCGLAMGAAFMTKNTALLLILLPLLGMIVVGPYRRLGNTLGLFFALIVALLAAAPWYLYVIQNAEGLGIAEPLAQLFRDWPMISPGAVETEQQRPVQDYFYYLLLVPLVFPWVIWLLGGLFQPWARGEGDRRRQLLLAWVWLVVGLVALSVPAAKQERYLIPLLPAVGLLVAQLWAFHIRLADDGLPDPGVNLLRIPHWVMLGLTSLALPTYLLLQRPIADLVNRTFAGDERLLGPIELPGLHPAVVVGVGAVLLGLVVIGAWWHWRWKPRPAFAASAAWAILLLSVVQFTYSRSYHTINPYRDDAQQVAQVIGGHPLRWLKSADRDEEPNEEFLFYLRIPGQHRRLSVDPIAPGQLPELRADHAVAYVMCRRAPEHARLLDDAGFAKVMEFEDGRFGGRSLYRALRLSQPAAPQPARTPTE